MIYVVRHGQTAWSQTGQHTGRTDIPLTDEGEAQARSLAPRLRRDWALVLASPLQRAWRTAELAGLHPEPEPDLVEWDYGHAEGLTTEQMSADRPWRIWDDPHLGETLEQVAERTRRVLARAPADGDTCLVAHGHVLRVLTAVYLGLEPSAAQHLVLEPSGIGILGHEHDWPALTGWNA
ncbi:MAG: histidine phosphatase super family protein [Frankiales bacterium]|nr:histidine phosphatase super family protein [Frankiales bacterium]